MRSWAMSARESFWFLPAVLGVAAVLVGQGFVTLDRILAGPILSSVPLLSELSANGGRSILTTVGTSMLTVAGTSFSITISVLATTSSTYGPRLVRNFMADRSNQFVLAMFTSTFLYCLVVVRSVRATIQDREAFVPTLGVHFGVLLAVADVAVLVYFIHHIATSVQITTLQKRVQTDLVRAVDVTHPASMDAGWARLATAPPAIGSDVTARKDGYVQRVDLDDLLATAVRHDLELTLLAMPGDHVIVGDALARMRGDGLDEDRIGAAVRRGFSIGVDRTPVQDLRFALRQLTEIAVRGLASGTNDPYTTVSALDLAASALVPLVQRPDPPNTRLDDDARPRLRFTWPRTEDLLASVLDSLRRYGLDHPTVVLAGLDLVGRLAPAMRTDALRAALAERTRELLEAYLGSSPDEPDRAAVAGRGDEVLRALHPAEEALRAD